ncbi:hypothetical protein ACFQ44_10040 [Levilactobacillus lanxiensis]|uniref:Uncharacterized protein n=1 Tax=Levilactobacillus lanxiensis TaxID=2799568 RepID=A0ABW4D3D1_9LACO|nr:hypothetical protein [Levilactobacillus lanxiensis]
MWKPRQHDDRHGWVLPDALLALAVVCLAVTLTTDFLQATHHLERQRQVRLETARQAHDRALQHWLDQQ